MNARDKPRSKERVIILTENEMDKIKTRLRRYYDTDEIDVDLANQIHQDGIKMFHKLGGLEKQVQMVQKQLDTKPTLINNGWEEERYILQNRIEELELFVNDLVFRKEDFEEIFKQAKHLLGNE